MRQVTRRLDYGKTEPRSEGKGRIKERRTNKREKTRHATTTIWIGERGMNKKVER
jgi:hypothetical protein